MTKRFNVPDNKEQSNYNPFEHLINEDRCGWRRRNGE